MIRALLWKDLRLASPAILTAALLFLMSFVSVSLLTQSMTPGPFPWFEAAVVAVHFCQWSMVVGAALLGGGSFATEREDGSHRFFHSLPIPLRDAVVSKLVIALIAFETFWLVLAFLTHGPSQRSRFWRSARRGVGPHGSPNPSSRL